MPFGIILASVTMQQNVFVRIYILWTTRNLQLDELELVSNVSMGFVFSWTEILDILQLKTANHTVGYSTPSYKEKRSSELNSWVIIGVTLIISYLVYYTLDFLHDGVYNFLGSSSGLALIKVYISIHNRSLSHTFE